MTLLLKLVLAPLLVTGSSLAGRRWGDRVTGVLVAFPIVAGPILLITCLEQGVAFGARAAAASLLGLVSLAVFAVVFAYAARRWRWPAAVAVSWLATGIADVVLAGQNLAAGWALTLVTVAIVTGRWLLTAVDEGSAGGGRLRPPWWDLPGRAAATATLVLFVTGIASTAGPVVTGILAPFPIATSVVAAFVHAQDGAAAVARTMAGVLQGLAGFAVFCFLVSVLLVPAGVGGAFAVAIAGVLVSQAVVMLARGRRSAVKEPAR
ncbi:hypothetical protein GCM10010112_65560 [Actinoplanes lobatus]|uniref:Putative membrane protein (GlpM family) n=1 Tax=Actinoplanes lobatus TaxID=113568 RepID=A0A7W7MJ08_9ACTN|nr:hypothetical protein [Actinoplanes lobatus]MBB4751968.1 putative membrane protein (GlpM family) [Actinoplanes lobatus]GGN85286.1 hypothetical protein GCM10010112_65560 [Actinoplanes lobatus]GIE44305.1 hypothetical protein Alo02nite_72030 [Actinoplanes lobatus]